MARLAESKPAVATAAIAATAPVEPFVDFNRVWLAYDDALASQGEFAVEDLSLQSAPGEFIAIVGPSGCGKSTFMKLATGLRPATRGIVKVAGQKVSGPLKQVGMAFQAPTLLPWRTTLDNVMLPLEIVEPYRSTLRARRDEYVDRARRLLHTVGLGGYEDKYPWQLSGGMQQRASICRALIHQPRMLLLDEPFGALDAFTREELWCVLRDLWQAQRFNVILVTHDLREAVFLADTVYVMSQRPGRIVMRKEIGLPRPRDLELTYTEPFAELVHTLREKIGHVRQH
ncbi:putative ABC TRANSPORTER, ATP-BINDING component [Cupriavidus taiwanensis]|uniref:ABC transporter ATP-binding protein n=1 Tax=Cupriavidus taiwanensis TaxID=164546 RepID=UPI000E17B5E4|nr:ABC transporter ATP-binding protein [Cupriavidus taiwanensis]SPA39379.1 putative ABC TRANSPORTER, ATP-BINDING component [Cupriavidus taiwanensis]